MLSTLMTLAVYFTTVFVAVGVFTATESTAGGYCWSGELFALDDSIKDGVMEATHETEANRTETPRSEEELLM
jgi:hypothetical protein